jgi:pyruvate dehydrogenase E2 component (dihydrolipoamide acetyltransferase)
MATEIIMPKAGMDMEEGTIIKWLVSEGDKVDTGDPILEILTDKVNMEVEAETTGTILKIAAKEGDVLPVFTVIGYIGKEGEQVPDASSSAPAKEEKPEKEQKQESIKSEAMPKQDESVDESGKVRATPAARKAGREKNIDLKLVKGSGPKGRVHVADVESFKSVKATPLAAKIAEVEDIDLSEVKGTGFGGKITKDDLISKDETGKAVSATKEEKPVEAKERKLIPMVGMRKIIADRMLESVKKAATVGLDIEIDMTAAIKLRSAMKDRILKETEKKITYTDLIIMAVSKALVKYPIVNSTLTDEGILLNEDVNMGLAVGLDNGLMVPVIKATDKMSLTEIVQKRTDTVTRTVKGKIKPDELQGSTFTISNLGMFDTVKFTSIINQPNSAILSVGAILERMRVIDGEPKVRSVMNMTLTMDHRVMDGVDGAKFLQYLKDLMEDPTLMLL